MRVLDEVSPSSCLQEVKTILSGGSNEQDGINVVDETQGCVLPLPPKFESTDDSLLVGDNTPNQDSQDCNHQVGEELSKHLAGDAQLSTPISKTRELQLTSITVDAQEPEPGPGNSPDNTVTDLEACKSSEEEMELRALLEAALFPREHSTTSELKKHMDCIVAILQAPHCKSTFSDLIIHEVYRAIESFQGDPRVQGRCFLALGTICQDSSTILESIVQSGGIKLILDALNSHQNVKFLQDCAVFAVLSFTEDASARCAIIDARGAEGVSWAIVEYHHSPSIVSNGATALCNLAFESDEAKKRIGKVGGINAVVDAMYYHADNADVQACCFLALRNLTFGMQANQWIAGKAGAMEVIVKAMQTFPRAFNLQMQGCIALGNLTADEPENRDRAAGTEAAKVCVRAAQANIHDAQMVEYILAGLCNLCMHHTDNQSIVGSAGGVQLCLISLRKHRATEEVVIKVCSLLRYLCFDGKNRQLLSENMGLEPLVRVLRDGIDKVIVANLAVLTLSNAIYNHAESKKAVGRYGGVAAVVDVMSNHLDSEDLQENGCRALRNLADSNDLNLRLLGDSGAVDAVIFAMMGYPQNAEIQEQACATLYNMSFLVSNVRVMKNLDVAHLVKHACQYHLRNEAIQCHSEALLKRLDPELKTSYKYIIGSFGNALSRGESKQEFIPARSPQTSSIMTSTNVLKRRAQSLF